MNWKHNKQDIEQIKSLNETIDRAMDQIRYLMSLLYQRDQRIQELEKEYGVNHRGLDSRIKRDATGS